MMCSSRLLLILSALVSRGLLADKFQVKISENLAIENCTNILNRLQVKLGKKVNYKKICYSIKPHQPTLLKVKPYKVDIIYFK